MFVHLQCHSHYSFLRGVNPPEEKSLRPRWSKKMPAVALTGYERHVRGGAVLSGGAEGGGEADSWCCA